MIGFKPRDYTILIVDHQVDRAIIITDELEDEENNVEIAYSGKEGFEIAKNKKVSLVLSDIKMPGGSGIEF